MKKKIFTGIGLLVAAMLLGTVAWHKVAHATSAQPLSLAVVSVQSGRTQADVIAEGEIVPSSLANVSVLTGYEARVAAVNVDVGSVVRRGQVMAELESYEQQDALRQTAAGVQFARARYALAVHPHRPEELQQMRLKLQADEQTVAESQARLALLQSGNRPQEIADARMGVQTTAARLSLATSENQRNQELFRSDLAPKAELEKSQTDLTVAQDAQVQAQEKLSLMMAGARPQELTVATSALNRAKLDLAQDEQQYAILIQGSRPEEIQSAAATLQQSYVEQHHQNLMFQHRLIRAPIAGVVIERNINPGEVASPGTAHSGDGQPVSQNPRSMFVLADTHMVEFIANVDQRYFRDLHIGQRTSIGIEALPGRTFTGTLVRRAPLIYPERAVSASNSFSPATALTFNIWVRLDNRQGLLVPGQTGLISLSSAQSGVMVPQSAVGSYKLGEGLAYVITNGTAHVRRVRYDATTDGNIHVLSGLKVGEQVAVSGLAQLRDGAQVTPIPVAPDADPVSAY